MTKAIIFDLDTCLAAADEVGVVRTGVCGHPRDPRWQRLSRKVAGGVRRVLARRVRCRHRQIRFHGSDAGWQVFGQTEVLGLFAPERDSISSRCLAIKNPNGIPSQSPGLRGTSYPGSSAKKPPQPQRGCDPSAPARALGLGHNAVGVVAPSECQPKVGADAPTLG